MPDFHNNLFFITALNLIASILIGPHVLSMFYWDGCLFVCVMYCLNVVMQWLFLEPKTNFPVGTIKYTLPYCYNLIFWCTHFTIINAFWNKYRFVSPSSKNRTKVNLKHMHKGYYTACQCWSIVPVTPNMHPIGICQLCMTLRFVGLWVVVFIKVH